MAEQRSKQISWKVYGGAAAVTALAFLAGIAFAYLGMNWRVSMIQNTTMDLFITMMSYQQAVQFANPCHNPKYVQYLGSELDRVGERLSQGDYPKYLLKQYALMESMHLQLIERMKRDCNADVHWILFFYGKGCADCDAQANILTRVKETAPNKVYIYAMRYNLESPIVTALRTEYNVTRVPTLVVDGKKFEGVVGYDDLVKVLGLSKTRAG